LAGHCAALLAPLRVVHFEALHFDRRWYTLSDRWQGAGRERQPVCWLRAARTAHV